MTSRRWIAEIEAAEAMGWRELSETLGTVESSRWWELATWDPNMGGLQELTLGHLSNDLDLIRLRKAIRVAHRALAPGGRLTVYWADPDRFSCDESGPWPGEVSDLSVAEGTESWLTRYRPLRQWIELIRLFEFEPRTPRPTRHAPGLLRCEAIRAATTIRRDAVDSRPCEARADARYGPGSTYRRFNRLEEPEVLDDLLFGVAAMRPRRGERALSIGVNDAQEWNLWRAVHAMELDLWGVDASPEAIDQARIRWGSFAEQLIVGDASDLRTLSLPRFDLVLILNTLQCTTVDRDALLGGLRDITHPGTRFLITIPNCHFGVRDILRRPVDRNDARHDRAAALKDIRFLTRYFHRAGYGRISTFGTYDLCLLVRP
ncbi:MAG: hypothetical protein KDC38_05960 [Planctomycetes bacterium]|nr:hypothetical protein [Planctomycetota bacterium]